MTFDDLSKKTGISRSVLRNLEKGHKSPNINTLIAITRFYKIPISHIMVKSMKKVEIEMMVRLLLEEGVIKPTMAALILSRL